MKGKQAILRYLETHRTFTAKDVAAECGMTINCITKNALELEKVNKLVRISKVWRTVTYRLATPEEQAGTAQLHQWNIQRMQKQRGDEENSGVLRESISMKPTYEELAVQLANAESKCRELAAELSAVDKIHNEAVFINDDHYEQCPPEVKKIIRSLAVLQIPACDAFLTEVRASGVDAAIEHLNKKFAGTGHTGVPVMALEWLAQELRKGAEL